MAIQKILTEPHPVLREKNADVGVSDFGSMDITRLLADMIDSMKSADGIGLAAPQIAANVRLCVITSKDGVIPFFNPEIVKASWRKIVMEEGCLSIPGVFGTVRRPKKITLKFQDVKGQQKVVDFDGLFARIVQHEVDHLNGILFIDKLIDITQGEFPKSAS
jgi:peptide deformylase